MTFRTSFLIFLGFLSSCESLIDAEPKGALYGANIYDEDKTAEQVVIGIYVKMGENGFASGGNQGINVLGGLSADEFIPHNSSALEAFETNELFASLSLVKAAIWEPGYKFVYYANSVLEGVAASKTISDGMRRQLEGEALFLRAFTFFYLTNLFGDVPLVMGTNYQVNNRLGRTPRQQVYEQIVADLRLAQELLPSDYSVYKQKRIRPNKAVASALLARVFLYMKDWANAEAEATKVIDNNLYELLADFDQVFLANSQEAIWQLGPVVPGINTREGMVYILTGFPQVVSLRKEVVDACEKGDMRALRWIGHIDVAGGRHYYPHKYKKRNLQKDEEVTEYSMVLRLAEQYLIRAEARTQQGKLNEAIDDVDAVRGRAGLPLLRDINPSITMNGLLQCIENERRIELLGEWGHRWLDLLRTGRAQEVLSGIKPGWQATDVLYPIPQSEIDANPNLKPQNSGY